MRKIIVSFILMCCFFYPMTQVSAAEKWEKYQTKHFMIYYKEAPEEFIKTVEESAEDYYAAILDNLGLSRHMSWDKRAQIYIYDDEKDYVNSAARAPWSRGTAVMEAKVIQTYPMAHGFFDTTLPHELGHIIFYEYIGAGSNIPLWFLEGVAMNQEKAKRLGADEEVRKAIQDKRFVPLQDLDKMGLTKDSDQETVMLFYAEAASAVHYLIAEFGEHKFSSFCQNLKKGSSFNHALESAYYRFDNVSDLNKAWLKYLKK